jgi:hypothetical protein
MNQKINMKEIERKAYTSYHQDGVIDIAVATVVLIFSIIILGDTSLLGGLGGISGILAVSIYVGLKKLVTIPRIGYVKFPQQRAQRITILTIVLGTLSAFMGVVAFLQTTSQGTTPQWILLLFDNYMLTIGISIAALFLLGGYAFKTKRIYVYALLTLTLFVPGHFIDFPLYYYLTALGITVLACGLALMTRFVHKFPKPTETVEA